MFDNSSTSSSNYSLDRIFSVYEDEDETKRGNSWRANIATSVVLSFFSNFFSYRA